MPGAVLGDMVRGSDYAAYPQDIALGIRLHRRVDTLNDRHPRITDALAAFPGEFRRHGTVLIDLVSDHCIANRWDELHTQSLNQFASHAGREIGSARRWFRQAGARPLLSIYFSELLKSYRSADGVQSAMTRTAMRMRKPEPMLQAIAHWRDASERLMPHLPELLTDMEAGVRLAIAEFTSGDGSAEAQAVG